MLGKQDCEPGDTAHYDVCISPVETYTVQPNLMFAARRDNGTIVSIQANTAYNTTRGLLTVNSVSPPVANTVIATRSNGDFAITP